jgi:adenylate cyclase
MNTQKRRQDPGDTPTLGYVGEEGAARAPASFPDGASSFSARGWEASAFLRRRIGRVSSPADERPPRAMLGRMPRSALQRLRLLAAIVAASTIIGGGCYGLSQEHGTLAIWPLAAGGAIGAFISSSIFGMELFAAGHLALLRRLPLPIAILVRAVAYGAVVVSAMLVFPWLFFGTPFSVMREGFARSIASSLWMTFVLGAVMTIVQVIGPEALGKLLLGHYHRPREEQRIVLFLDLVDSTRIAELLGNVGFHALLAEVFARFSAIVTDWGGDVHRYVGDELIATWRVGKPTDNARAVAAVFECADALAEAQLAMRRRYGASPKFRAGIHRGALLAGEIGGFKREISYVGEAMNTAARLEQACRETGRMLLVSKAFLDDCELAPHNRAMSLGQRTLRGMAGPTELFAIERPRDSGVAEASPRLTSRTDRSKSIVAT